MWSILFIPAETDHIDVTIDGNFWHKWNSADGVANVPLTFNQFNENINVFAIGQEGKNAKLMVLWDNSLRHQMSFDGANGESCNCNRDHYTFKV